MMSHLHPIDAILLVVYLVGITILGCYNPWSWQPPDHYAVKDFESRKTQDIGGS